MSLNGATWLRKMMQSMQRTGWDQLMNKTYMFTYTSFYTDSSTTALQVYKN